MNPVRPFHYIYVLRNKTNFYTGCTSDLSKRMKEHLSGKSNYTKKGNDHTLVYYEACLNKDDAYRRERYLKTGMGKRYIKNRIAGFLQEGLTG